MSIDVEAGLASSSLRTNLKQSSAYKYEQGANTYDAAALKSFARFVSTGLP